jgi:hypothetical protein
MSSSLGPVLSFERKRRKDIVLGGKRGIFVPNPKLFLEKNSQRPYQVPDTIKMRMRMLWVWLASELILSAQKMFM